MKLIVIMMAVFVLASCTLYQSAQYFDYVEPTSGKVAVIKADAELKGLFLSGKKTVLSLFSGCYQKNDKLENVLGSVNIYEADFGLKEIRIPAGQELFIKYGTLDSKWNCNAAMRFMPEEGQIYRLDYKMVVGGCDVNFETREGGRVKGLKRYDHSDTSTTWRKCES